MSTTAKSALAGDIPTPSSLDPEDVLRSSMEMILARVPEAVRNPRLKEHAKADAYLIYQQVAAQFREAMAAKKVWAGHEIGFLRVLTRRQALASVRPLARELVRTAYAGQYGNAIEMTPDSGHSPEEVVHRRRLYLRYREIYQRLRDAERELLEAEDDDALAAIAQARGVPKRRLDVQLHRLGRKIKKYVMGDLYEPPKRRGRRAKKGDGSKLEAA